MLERLPSETDLQYHERLVRGKLEDGTLSDVDYSELAKYVYGQDYSSDFTRRMMYGSLRTLQLLSKEQETCNNGNRLDELELKRIELQKERQKYCDQRTAYNKLIREQARVEEFKELMEKAILEGNLPKLEFEPLSVYDAPTSLIVSLNDIHYGAQHDNYWGKYNSDICKQMFEKYINAIANISVNHHAQDCFVTANGDLISGIIHKSIRITNKENVVEQITGVSELIAQFLCELSVYFSNIYFISVAGNHSRLDPKDDALNAENLDNLVEWYLKARLAEFEHIHISCAEKIDPTMYLIDVRGHLFVGVHGDFEPSITNVTNLQAMVGRSIYGVLMAHRHHNATDVCQGIRIIQSGSFLGTDNYCISKRLFGKPEQIVTVVDDDGIVCNYNVSLEV